MLDSTIYLSEVLPVEMETPNHLQSSNSQQKLISSVEDPSLFLEEKIAERPLLYNTMFFLFLFCFIIIANVFHSGKKLLPSMVSELFSQKDRKSIFSATVSNEVYGKLQLCLQTVIISSIFIYKVFSTHFQVIDMSVKNALLLIGGSSLLMILFIFYKWLAYFVVGKVFFGKESFSQWMGSFSSLIGIMGVILFVPVLFMFYIDSIYTFCLIFIVICLLLFVIIAIYKTFVLFFHDISLLLHLFLYLCAQEIIPLLFLYKGLVYLFNIAESNILWL